MVYSVVMLEKDFIKTHQSMILTRKESKRNNSCSTNRNQQPQTLSEDMKRKTTNIVAQW